MTELPATLQAYFKALDVLDKEAFLNCFADSPLVHEDPVGTPPHTNKAEMAAWWDQIASLFETVHFTVDDFYAGGPDQWALHFTCRGAGRNGKAVVFPGIDFIQLDAHGKICALRAFWDAGPVLGELMS